MGWFSDLLGDIAGGDYLFVAAIALLVGYAIWRAYWGWFGNGRPRPYKRFAGLTIQIGMTLMMERLYEFARAHVAVAQLTALATSNGYRLYDWEVTHGIFIEQGLEHFFLRDTLLMHAIYFFYAFAHLFVTLSFLIWVYMRRHEAFSFVRNLYYLTTAAALVIYMTFPTSPPRLYTNLGFQDPAVILGFAPAGGLAASQQTFNPYAAMPSLHLVYALIVGATLVILGRHLWLRIVGAIYPMIMLAVILISANHWVLDSVGSVIVVSLCAAALFLARAIGRKGGPIVKDWVRSHGLIPAPLYRRLEQS